MDFSGQNLRGQNFKGQDLTGANFSYADIRGANFTDAILRGADFTGAKAGLQKRWLAGQLLVAFLTSALSGVLARFAGAFTSEFFTPDATQGLTITRGILILAVLFISGIAITHEGFTADAFGKIAIAIAVAVAISLAGAVAVAGIVAVAIAGAAVGAISFTVAGINAIAFVVAITSALLFAVSRRESIATAIAVTVVLFSIYIARCTLKGDKKFMTLRTISVTFGAWGGTTFQGSDLTDANFSKTILRSTNFVNSHKQPTIFTRIYWADAQNLDRARVGNSYLQYSSIRQLVLTLQGQGHKCDRLNLSGINLKGANLQDASFIGADLNDANLQDANLSRAFLKQTQLDGADLTGACLTGAYIEDWGITGETKLDGVRCEYVYMHVPTNDDPDPLRKPDNRNEVFADGDFADFIKPIVDTLDLYHNQGVDPRAIAIAFKNLAEDNPEAKLEIVAMEKRGPDKILLRAKTAPGVDKSELSQAYFEDYNQLKSLPTEQLILLITEKGDRIRSLENMVATALQKPTFYAETYQHQGDFMPENSGININAGRDIGNVSGLVGGDVSGVVNLGELSGQVTNSIDQLSASPQPDEPGIKELLEQLHRAIESADELKPEDKAEALKQMQALADAGKDPAEPEKKNGAKSAIRWLKGMLTELAEPSAIVQLCKHVLPQIAGIFGL